MKIKNLQFLLRTLFVATLLWGFSTTTMASHFRYGAISYEHISTDTSITGAITYTYDITVKQGWRRSFFNVTTVGQTVYTGSINFGNGTASNILNVTSINFAEDWFFAEKTYTRVYTSPGNKTVYFASCCRISGLILNGASSSFNVNTIINVGSGNNSPIQTIAPIVNLPVNSATTFSVAAFEPDGQTMTYSMGFKPAAMSVNSSTGVISWNTTGQSLGSLHLVQAKVSDGSTTVFSDFIVRIVGASNPPVFDYTVTPVNNTIIKVAPGDTVAFPVKATDSDPGSTVVLTAVGITGGTMTPSLPTAAANPVTSNFFWIPTVGDVGVSVISYTATDNLGVQANTGVTIVVSLDPVFDVPPTPVFGAHNVIEPGTNLTFTAQASDPDPNDSVRIIEAKHKVTGLDYTTSMGATFAMPTAWGNPTSGVFSWTPVVSQWGHHHVIFKAEDSYGDTVLHEVAIFVNTTPVFTSSPVITATVGVPYSYSIVLHDPDTAYGDTVSILSGLVLPSWLTLVDNGDGTATLSGTPAVSDLGMDTLDILGEDLYHHLDVGGSPNQAFIITIGNPQTGGGCPNDTIAPYADCQLFTAYLGLQGVATVTGADINKFSSDNCGIASMTAYPNTFTVADTGANLVTLTVTDSAGNSSTCQTYVIVALSPGTSYVTVELDDSQGNGLLGGVAEYNNGVAWVTIGSTDSLGEVSGIIGAVGLTQFRMTWSGASQAKNVWISGPQIVTFQTMQVSAELNSSNGGDLLANFEYKQGGSYLTFDSGSNTTIATMELLPVGYMFKVYYNGNSIFRWQNVSGNSNVVFSTVGVTVELNSHDGSDLMANFKMYNTVIGSGNDTSEVHIELLPMGYYFRAYWNGEVTGKFQHVGYNSQVVFTSFVMTAQLNSSTGSDLAASFAYTVGGTGVNWIPYNSGVPTTLASIETISQQKRIKVSYLDKSIWKWQYIANDTSVVFNTVNVTLKLVDGSGSDLIGTAEYRPNTGSYLTFGTGSTPTTMELLNGGYGFRSNYLGVNYNTYQNIATSNSIVELTAVTSSAKADNSSTTEESLAKVTMGVYPNPFSEFTNFTFDLDEATNVRLVIYDLSGKIIRTLADREFEQGTNQVRWDGNNLNGNSVANGVYFYRLQAGEFVKTNRIIVTR